MDGSLLEDLILHQEKLSKFLNVKHLITINSVRLPI